MTDKTYKTFFVCMLVVWTVTAGIAIFDITEKIIAHFKKEDVIVVKAERPGESACVP